MTGRATPTDDGHHVVVDGRRWRATDPGIPEKLRAELVAELMTARRMVSQGHPDGRPRVQDAKVALGERGHPWWEPSPDGHAARLRATFLALLRHRDGTSLCPSDAARVVGAEAWRSVVGAARDVAWQLADEGLVEVHQKGRPIVRAGSRGPVRIVRGPRFPAP